MNYKVLYRKYRPKDFDEIVGQEYIVKTLKNSIINNKISHAYIFSGPRGTGKTSTAKIFAKTINCLDIKNGISCNKCEKCINFNENPDVIEIDAASNNGINEIRELKNNTNTLPTNSKYKIFIIDEFHMITTEAFNALLKTLEEPPSHVIFIMATTDIQKVPITILSRCQRFDFKKLTKREIILNLTKISQKEKIKITSDAIEEIAEISDGGMRDALSILDQANCLNNEVTIEDINKITGNVSTKLINDTINAIINNKNEDLSNIFKQLSDIGADYKNFVDKLLTKLKDTAIIYKFEKKDNDEFFRIKNIMINITSELEYLKNISSPLDILEIILLSYIKSTDEKNDNQKKEEKKIIVDTSSSEVEKNKEIEKTNNISQKNSIIISREIILTRINNCFCSANRENLKLMKSNWLDFKKVIEKKHRDLLSMLSDSNISAASNEYAIITTDNEITSNIINNSILKIEKIYNKQYKFNYKFISVSNEEFLLMKKEYVKNIKNNVKYKMKKDLLEEKEENSDFNVVNELFSSEIIEIR